MLDNMFVFFLSRRCQRKYLDRNLKINFKIVFEAVNGHHEIIFVLLSFGNCHIMVI